jgi:hypothetical protein
VLPARALAQRDHLDEHRRAKLGSLHIGACARRRRAPIAQRRREQRRIEHGEAACEPSMGSAARVLLLCAVQPRLCGVGHAEARQSCEGAQGGALLRPSRRGERQLQTARVRFEDGNGRIHRYLIHDVLAKAGFTPRGIVLPVSAVILANLEEYIESLEQFSRPLNRRTDYNPDVPHVPATGNDKLYFQYPDLTAQAEFLYKALERTISHDLQQEIDYLLGFDRASTALNSLLDWPAHSMELFIRVVRDNDGTLSANKRKSHFSWMQDDEVSLNNCPNLLEYVCEMVMFMFVSVFQCQQLL